ncbi:unnamed protein product [Lactuca saligna]|uniref:Uncharacterized protein n=1 Tax=Lactuca saligna TaxID=75948 RepID=A0AA35ZUU3_LACSI|nr:unnamed protein product [Lactuca saligna]
MANGDVDIVVEDVQGLFESIRSSPSAFPLIQILIDMVPSGRRDISPTSFDPRVVSIGPLHREDKTLQAFEHQKHMHASDLLNSPCGSSNQTLKECVQKVLATTDRIRACYDNIKIEKYNDNELAKMMVIDACFILQFIRVLTNSSDEAVAFLRASSIIYDLMLFENQIPFFILQDIFDSTILTSEPKASLPHLILQLVQFFNIFETNIPVQSSYPIEPNDHILGFLEKCFRPSKEYSPLQALPSVAMHSTVELERSGVIFKPNIDARWAMTINFQSSTAFNCFSWSRDKPTLRMPVLRIDNFTESILRNLIAYEQSSSSYRTCGYVTSYAMAMDMLVDTEEDIGKLIESKVVVNHLGSNEKAADMINSLCKELPFRRFYYFDDWREMDRHYNSYWPKNIAALKRTYFSNPWSMIALVAAIVLFALTVVQTIYTVNAI